MEALFVLEKTYSNHSSDSMGFIMSVCLFWNDCPIQIICVLNISRTTFFDIMRTQKPAHIAKCLEISSEIKYLQKLLRRINAANRLATAFTHELFCFTYMRYRELYFKIRKFVISSRKGQNHSFAFNYVH